MRKQGSGGLSQDTDQRGTGELSTGGLDGAGPAADNLTGAQALITTLVGAGVDVCFTNPGTSEMHFVQALDSVPAMRGGLAPFGGLATGGADGCARIAGRPASVLLHLGPGLSNGLANLHNARRAHSPMVVVVGAHATGHARYALRCTPTSRGRRAPSRAGSTPRAPPAAWPATLSVPSPPAARTAGRSPRWCCPPTCRGAGAASWRRPPRRSRHRPPARASSRRRRASC